MIPYSSQYIDQEDIDSVLHALQSTHLTQGKRVEAFESALCEYLGVKHACVVNSGTSALLCAYHAIGLEEGDEIITTPITFAATSNMAVHLGATPVFCDVKQDGNIDETQIETLITDQTKVLAPVDFAGKPVEMDALLKIAKKHRLKVIEDASHALGSEYGGQKVGTKADATVLSFHAIKPITTMEGGAVVTNDPEIDQRVRLYRSHGIVKKKLWNSDMEEMGFNFRLSDVACALGLSQLHKLGSFINIRNEIAENYERLFAGNPYFETIVIPENQKSARHLYPILLNQRYWCPKEEIFQALQEAGLGVQVHYKPTYRFSYYQKRFGEKHCMQAEQFYKAELSIPCHQKMEEKDIRFVADTLLSVLEKYSKEQWLQSNKEAIEEQQQRIERRGVFGSQYRRF